MCVISRCFGVCGDLRQEDLMVIFARKEKEGMRVGNKYELGRTLGEGNFGKVKFARNLDSGHPFAVKILEKQRIIDLKITDQVNFCYFCFFEI